MNIVYFTFPQWGHMAPTLGVIRELTKTGANIFCYSTGVFRTAIEKTGAVFLEYPRSDLFDTSGPPAEKQHFEGLTPQEILECHKFVRSININRLLSDSCKREVEMLDISCIIYDFASVWGKVIAQQLDIRHICSLCSLIYPPNVVADLDGDPDIQGRHPLWGRLSGTIHSIKSNIGIIEQMLGYKINSYAPDPVSDSLNIFYTANILQPCHELFHGHYRFSGHCSAEQPQDPRNKLVRWMKGAERVIYITFGNHLQQDMIAYYSFCRRCINVFRRMNCKVIMKTTERELFPNLPDNFYLAEQVPQAAIMKDVHLYITHGGLIGVTESLYNGIPVMVIPQWGDHFLVAESVSKLEAGRYLLNEEISEAALYETAEELLENPNYKNNCEQISGTLKNHPGAKLAATAILETISS